MSKRPPLGTTGKLALAGKHNRARQLLDHEQREHNCRDLLSLVGKNSPLAVSSCSGQGTPSRNKRYATCIASAEKARLNVDLLLAGVSTDIRAHGITDVAKVIVVYGDGGKPIPPTSELDAVDEESDSGTENDADANDSSGSSGSSGGGVRVKSERAARDAALVTLPVPNVIVKVVPGYFSCCIDTHCRSVDDQMSPRQLCINCKCIAHLACSENLIFQNSVEMEFIVTVGDFTRAAKSRIRATPKSQHVTLFFCFLCKANIRAAKEKKMAKQSVPSAPHKTSLIVTFPIKILAELR